MNQYVYLGDRFTEKIGKYRGLLWVVLFSLIGLITVGHVIFKIVQFIVDIFIK